MRAWVASAALVICGATAGQCDNIAGAGNVNCAEFGRVLAASGRTENLFFSWALGFMSAANQYDKLPRDLAAVTADKEMATIRAYCNVHPLADYADAVASLWNTLPANKVAR
jgi:hypothetical protein